MPYHRAITSGVLFAAALALVVLVKKVPEPALILAARIAGVAIRGGA